jgi:hypothetical protein
VGGQHADQHSQHEQRPRHDAGATSCTDKIFGWTGSKNAHGPRQKGFSAASWWTDENSTQTKTRVWRNIHF